MTEIDRHALLVAQRWVEHKEVTLIAELYVRAEVFQAELTMMRDAAYKLDRSAKGRMAHLEARVTGMLYARRARVRRQKREKIVGREASARALAQMAWVDRVTPDPSDPPADVIKDLMSRRQRLV